MNMGRARVFLCLSWLRLRLRRSDGRRRVSNGVPLGVFLFGFLGARGTDPLAIREHEPSSSATAAADDFVQVAVLIDEVADACRGAHAYDLFELLVGARLHRRSFLAFGLCLGVKARLLLFDPRRLGSSLLGEL